MLPSLADLKRVLCTSGSKFTCPHPHPRRGSNPVLGSPVCEYTFTTNSSEAWEVELADVILLAEPDSEFDAVPISELCVELDTQPDIELTIPIIVIIAIKVTTGKYCWFFLIGTPPDFFKDFHSYFEKEPYRT